MRNGAIFTGVVSWWLVAAGGLIAAEPKPPVSADHRQVMQWIDPQGGLHPVTSPAEWRIRRGQILKGMQEVMGPLPGPESRCDLDVQVLDTEDLPTLTRRKISYLAGPGDRIPAYLLVPKGRPPRSCPAMLCLHGTDGPRGRTAGLGADYPRYALELAQRGYVTIAPDYTLLGDNQTDPAALGYASGTMKGIWSHVRALDLLETIAEVDAARMGTIGVSLGGHNSLFVGAFDDRLKVVVTSSGFDSFSDYGNGNPKDWSQTRYMPRIATAYGMNPARIPFDFPEVLAAIAPRGLFIHAPQSDHDFKVNSAVWCAEEARKVFHLLGADTRLEIVTPPGGHGFPPEQRLAAYAFIDELLGHEPVAPPVRGRPEPMP